MPTYEYACRDCGHHLEVVQSFSDAPLTVCGSCGGGLRKVFSAAGIIFKGSGYYVTDTRASGKRAGKGERDSSGAKEGDGAAATGDAATSSGGSSSGSSDTPSSGGGKSGDAKTA